MTTMSVRKPHPKVISLYSGAGGLDYGFEAAGFETVFANDFEHDSCQTLRLNRKWPVIERSIFDVPTEEILEMAGVGVGEIDTLIGGPPLAWGITKMLSAGFCVPIIGSLDLGLSLTDPANSLSLTQCPSTNSYWFSMLELMK